MKRIFVIFAALSLAVSSCKNDSTEETVAEVDIATQNSYDDQAAQKYLADHYFDAKGNIKEFSDTDTSDDLFPKLSSLNPQTLPSGVIYVVRPNAQPVNGKTIGNSDILHLMSRTITYVATNTNNVVSYSSPSVFRSTIEGTGIPETDPMYYYVKKAILDAGSADFTKVRSYYEIEGFKEALQKFQAFNIADADDYNLQGVIIVPSRAAFARDPHANYTGISYRNRSFVFNFQVYKAETAPDPR